MRTMNDETLQTRTQQLVASVYAHKHKDELIKLMEEQLLDDSCVFVQSHKCA